MEQRITVYKLKPTDRRFWKLEWVEPDTGIRRSESSKTDNEDEAERKRADKEYELNHGLHHRSSKMGWEQFTELYLTEKLGDKRQGTKDKGATVLETFGKLAHPRSLGHVSERMISKYASKLREEGFAVATISGHLAYPAAAFNWAVKQRLLPVALNIAMPKLPRKVKIRKTDEEGFKRLLLAAPTRLWQSFIACAWYTGMRRTEMLELEWAEREKPWVDLAHSRIWIPAAYNKSDEDQWMPIHPDLVPHLQAVQQERGCVFPLSLSKQEVSRKFTKLAAVAGRNITLHDLRRSFGSRYASKVPAPVLRRLMRHSSIETTLKFYTDVDDTLDEAIKKA